MHGARVFLSFLFFFRFLRRENFGSPVPTINTAKTCPAGIMTRPPTRVRPAEFFGSNIIVSRRGRLSLSAAAAVAIRTARHHRKYHGGLYVWFTERKKKSDQKTAETGTKPKNTGSGTFKIFVSPCWKVTEKRKSLFLTSCFFFLYFDEFIKNILCIWTFKWTFFLWNSGDLNVRQLKFENNRSFLFTCTLSSKTIFW